METVLIPFRIYHFDVPEQHVLKVLRIILDHEIRYFMNKISDDERILNLTLSINMNKVFQCNALQQVEALLSETS